MAILCSTPHLYYLGCSLGSAPVVDSMLLTSVVKIWETILATISVRVLAIFWEIIPAIPLPLIKCVSAARPLGRIWAKPITPPMFIVFCVFLSLFTALALVLGLHSNQRHSLALLEGNIPVECNLLDRLYTTLLPAPNNLDRSCHIDLFAYMQPAGCFLQVV